MTAVSYRARRIAVWAVALALLVAMSAPLALTASAQETDLAALEGEIISDGSSTVGPITNAVAEEFGAEAENVNVQVDISGTGGGFGRFCAGETDIQNASREIEDDELALCEENGVDYFVFEVAFDGITFVTNPANDFLECLNTEALALLWSADGGVETYQDLNPDFPDNEVTLYGPGTDSGTYDFFVETILEDGEIREDFTPSEDDEVIVSAVAGEESAIGYFGYAYYAENQDELGLIAIDGGDGCVEPSPETIRDGSYQPLSRPLFVYVSAESMERPEIQEFARFYIENAGELAEEVGFVASPDEVYTEDAEKVEAAIAGEAEPDGPAGAAEATPEA